MEMAIKKQELKNMVNDLSDRDVPLVYHLLTRLIGSKKDDHIPFDDEPLTENDLKAIKEAEEDYLQYRTIRFEDIEDEI
jgi:hypothetical protein